ncbi:MAG: cation:proton antiporter, partial [Myxococcales bacterium]|nr:cation:proton antiporter [Myxococcales bacterium]
WEGVLIDAVGVFIAAFCFEYLSGKGHEVVEPIVAFGVRLLVGLGLGLVAGLLVGLALVRHWVEDEHVNIFALATVLVTFGVSNAAMEESGILAVVTAGLVIGWMRPRQLARMKTFKLELTELAIGLLFILLSAKLELARFAELGVDLVILVVIVLFALRPLNILVSTAGLGFAWRERLFLSWLAPRGIVAASMASLFSLRLQALGYPEAVHLETLTYAVIATTVALQGLSAPLVARLLGVNDPPRRTWLVLGEPALAGGLGRALQRAGVRAHTFVGPNDSDPMLEVAAEDAATPADAQLNDVDWVLIAYNDGRKRQLAARTWAGQVGRQHCLVWTQAGQPDADREETPGVPAFSTLKAPADVAAALSDGSLAVHLCDTRSGEVEAGRFGPNFAPLFWIAGDIAIPELDPLHDPVPRGEHAVVLKRRVPGFDGLIADVEVLDDEDMTMRGALLRLLQVVAVDEPQLPLEALLEGLLEREATMSSSVGGGIAIPHAYFPGLERPRCYLALVPGGLGDATPDDVPLRLVCLVLSPPDRARDHLQALAALAIVLGDEAFRALLLRQDTPEQAQRLLDERA